MRHPVRYSIAGCGGVSTRTRAAWAPRATCRRGEPLRGGVQRELLVQRVALDDCSHPLGQLARARLIARRQREREDLADLLEVLSLQSARGERGRADT